MKFTEYKKKKYKKKKIQCDLLNFSFFLFFCSSMKSFFISNIVNDQQLQVLWIRGFFLFLERPPIRLNKLPDFREESFVT